jgi:hypothetical protein
MLAALLCANLTSADVVACDFTDPDISQDAHTQNISSDQSSSRLLPNYQIIIWQPQSAVKLGGLSRLGVTAGKIMGTRSGPIDLVMVASETEAFRAHHLHWFLENIATDFYSPYHRWRPDRPVNWAFQQAKQLYRVDPGDIRAFIRIPSLSDPERLKSITLRLQQHVRAYAPYHPLYYSLADEAGIADLSAAWDFDFAAQSLRGMRSWLKQQYGSLVALNREWGTQFSSWSAVVPMTTDAALKRPDENFSAWADFKEWMDVAFARAVRTGTDALHAADPHALSALEGGQIPGWGGYNYSHLATAVDIMEMTDEGNGVEIALSLSPKLSTLMTSSLVSSKEVHSVWHRLLLGGRGLILWDPDGAFVGDDGCPTERGLALRRLASQVRPIAAQLVASKPVYDPVAILYSPESFRTQWLLDRKADGKPWADREADTEYNDGNAVRVATGRAAKMLSHVGVQPRWLTSEMIERGDLQTDNVRVLVLPHTIALSLEAARHIRAFVSSGGSVLADTEPGLFDAHSRRLAQPLLADLTGSGSIMLIPALQKDAVDRDITSLDQLQHYLEQAGVPLRFTLSADTWALVTDVDARVFQNGETTIIGLQRDWVDNENRGAENVTVYFQRPFYVSNLQHTGTSVNTAQVRLSLGPITPVLLSVSRNGDAGDNVVKSPSVK